MAEVIDRHAAAIDAGFALGEGLERFGAACEAVGEAQGHRRTVEAAKANSSVF